MSQSPRRVATILFGLTFAAAAVTSGPPPAVAGTATYSAAYTIDDAALTSPSGMARSLRGFTLFYHHNAAAGGNKIYGVNYNDGLTKMKITLSGAVNTDWEDIAAGLSNTLWVGDIGDAAENRTAVRLWSFTEPASVATAVTVTPTKYTLAYGDGRSHDAHALMINPSTGRIYVVTDEATDAGIWVAPATLSTTATNTLTRVASAPPGITGAAWAPDGSQFSLASQSAIYVYAGLQAVPEIYNAPAMSGIEAVDYGRGSNKLFIAQRLTTASKVRYTPTLAADTNWRLDLNEGFASLDTTRWNVQGDYGWQRDDGFVLRSNVSATGGQLQLQADVLDPPRQQCWTVDGSQVCETRSYSSAGVDSQGGYDLPNTFRAEVHARVPVAQGTWAAPLWFRPAGSPDGEIDLVETKHESPALVRQDVHADYASNRHQQLTSPLADPAGWHYYVVEKTAGRIAMYVDGVRVPTASWTAADPAWFDDFFTTPNNRWYLRIDLQLGGAFGGAIDPAAAWGTAETRLDIDQIRTWVPA